jgi:hypothetical protein
MAFSLRRGEQLPGPIHQALELGPGERVLTWAREESTGATVVVSNHRLYAVDAAGVRTLVRPWHEVDAGTWSSELGQLTVTWVGGARPSQWTLGDSTLLPETLRERVQASVVLAQRVDLGPRRSARVVIRQNLATGELVEQVVTGRGVRADDEEVASATARALVELREQVGLD